MNPIIIIGSGLAGYGMARELRKLDSASPLMIITQDTGDSYSKPMLSAAFSQSKSAENLVMASAEKMASDLNAQILTKTQVEHIDTANKTVSTSQGVFNYQALILSLGADTIRPNLDGDGVAEVLSVNDLWDYAQFRLKLEGAKSVAILGSGLIGCEFANDLAGKGFDISVIGMTKTPLSPLLPEVVGAALQKNLNDLGVHWFLGSGATSVNKVGASLSVELNNGEKIEADVVLSAIGLRARTSLALEAGITINRGVVVDEYCRTSAADVYALGDCMEFNAQIMPYVMPIMHCSRAIAKSLTGEATAVVFPAMPVAIKTAAYPITVLPAPINEDGKWVSLEENGGFKLAYVNKENQLKGFVLTEGKTSQRMAMAALLNQVIDLGQ